jgi:predicted DNA-binding protein
MSTQMIIRLDPGLKEKITKLAKKEGKSLSELVRELLEKYTKERDMGSYIDNLWDRIGKKMFDNNITLSDINSAIKEVRSRNEKSCC